VEGDLVTLARGHVAIHAVDRGVQLAPDEPLGERDLPVQHVGPRLGPLERPGLLLPPGSGIGIGLLIDARLGVGLGDELFGRFETATLVQ
jgi:hypothetical protein